MAEMLPTYDPNYSRQKVLAISAIYWRQQPVVDAKRTRVRLACECIGLQCKGAKWILYARPAGKREHQLESSSSSYLLHKVLALLYGKLPMGFGSTACNCLLSVILYRSIFRLKIIQC